MQKETEKIVDQALSVLKRKPVEGYEIYLNQSSHLEVESQEGKIETFQTSHYLGMSCRILNHQRMGFSYATFPNPLHSDTEDLLIRLDRMAEDAIRSAEATSPDSCFDFAPALQTLPPTLLLYDETFRHIPEKIKIEKAKQLEESARSVDTEKIKRIRKASYEEELSRRTLINSNGLHFSYNRTLASVSVTAIAQDSGESEVGWDFDTSHFLNRLDVEKTGRSAGREALERLGGKRIPTGTYPVLLNRQVAAEFLSLLVHSFEADQIQKGKSPLKGKRGETFFSSLLNIVDDGLYPEGISSAPIDGEGMPSQRTPLVVRGEVTGYLYDRYWAGREKASAGFAAGSTGNSRRHGIKSPPVVGISNFFIEPGGPGLSKLRENLSQGILINEVMGLHTIDPISGDFSLGCSGDWILRGEKIHPVKSIAVAGNLFDLFKKVIGIGNDLRFFGGIGSPSLLIEDMIISGN